MRNVISVAVETLLLSPGGLDRVRGYYFVAGVLILGAGCVWRFVSGARFNLHQKFESGSAESVINSI